MNIYIIPFFHINFINIILKRHHKLFKIFLVLKFFWYPKMKYIQKKYEHFIYIIELRFEKFIKHVFLFCWFFHFKHTHLKIVSKIAKL